SSNLFFFSSRRRHTRSKRDWSSDVCSSDLTLLSIPKRLVKIFLGQDRDDFYLLLAVSLLLLPVWQCRHDPSLEAKVHHILACASSERSYPAWSYPMHVQDVIFR